MLPLRYCRLTMFGSVHIEWGEEYLGKVTWCYDHLRPYDCSDIRCLCVGNCYFMVCSHVLYLLRRLVYRSNLSYATKSVCEPDILQLSTVGRWQYEVDHVT